MLGESFLGLRQHGFDVFGYLAGFGDGRVAANHGAIARDEEFGEIPFDGIGEEATCLRLEILDMGSASLPFTLILCMMGKVTP